MIYQINRCIFADFICRPKYEINLNSLLYSKLYSKIRVTLRCVYTFCPWITNCQIITAKLSRL